MTLGRRLSANQKTFHRIKIQKMAGISKYYWTKLLKKVLIKMFTFSGIIYFGYVKVGKNQWTTVKPKKCGIMNNLI